MDTKRRRVSTLLETRQFPIEQDTILAYSGNARQRRKAWRADATRIIAACKAEKIGISEEGNGKRAVISGLFGHVVAVVKTGR